MLFIIMGYKKLKVILKSNKKGEMLFLQMRMLILKLRKDWMIKEVKLGF